MTFREKLREEYPQCMGDRFRGGVLGCPIDYDYEESCCEHYPIPGAYCEGCWDREMPEPENSNICDGRKILETKDLKGNIDISIWPEAALLLAVLGLFFIVAISQMI